MESVLIAASIFAAASTNGPASVPTADPALDERCLRLMAALAEEEDPRVQRLGRTAAQYFLGRLDATRPGFDLDAALAADAPASAEREALLGRCGEAMQAGGRDFRTIGEELAAPFGRPIA